VQDIIVEEIRYENWKKVFDEMLKEGQDRGFFNELKEQVVVKPNLCSIASPESGVTTDVELIERLVVFLRQIKPKVRITIIESDSFDRDADEVFVRLGYTDLSKKYGIELVNLTQEESYETRHRYLPYPLRIPKLFFDDFFFISVANLKTHTYQKVTLVYKNQFGCIPDKFKDDYHEYLEKVLYLLNNKFMPADLCIVDGRVGLQGEGPVDGNPIKSNILVIGKDPTTVDTICCRIMGFQPNNVPYLRYAYRRNKMDYRKVILPQYLRQHDFGFTERWRYNAIRGKIRVTRTCDYLKMRLKRYVHIFFRLPSYVRERLFQKN
jgi:uncharacterized protein (DUF362 family)